jgi:hypothetical protein
MTNAIETAYKKLDDTERGKVDDISKQLIKGFQKHADAKYYTGHRFDVTMARELLVKVAVYQEHKKSMQKVVNEEMDK